LKEQDLSTNPFKEDVKLASWWQQLNTATKKTHLEQAKLLEQQIVLEHNRLKQSQECSTVSETVAVHEHTSDEEQRSQWDYKKHDIHALQ
jgi:predicted transposase YdaD